MLEGKSISAVVISYRGMEFIPDCLRTLSDELDQFDHEIIVVDNGSDDGTIRFIETDYPDLNLIKNESNLGFAQAVNQGIQMARGDYLWILNQDIRIRSGCLKTLLECHISLDKVGVIGPRFVGFDGQLQKCCRRFPRYHHLIGELTGLNLLLKKSSFFNGWKMGDFDHLSSRAVEQPMGAAMLLTRQIIDDIGLMDEKFGMFFNDVDYCHRIVKSGWTNFYCHDAVIEHYLGGSSSRSKPKMIWLAHLGMYRYYCKYEKSRNLSGALRLIRWPLPHLVGVLLFLAAIPRWLYHLSRKII